MGPSYLLGQLLALLGGHRLLLHVVELGDGLGVVAEVNLGETEVTRAAQPQTSQYKFPLCI